MRTRDVLNLKNLFGASSMRTIAAGVVFAGVAGAEPAAAAKASQPYPSGAGQSLKFGEVSTNMDGYQNDFCPENPAECQVKTNALKVLHLTPASWRLLQRINDHVNESIVQVQDQAHFGVIEKWTYPKDGMGDCEDLALLKRKMLIERGVPMSAVPILVVNQKNGDGHAILAVRTDKGDFALDNIARSIIPVHETGYTLKKAIDPADSSQFRLVEVAPVGQDVTMTAARLPHRVIRPWRAGAAQP